jgi:hypothetical protein
MIDSIKDEARKILETAKTVGSPQVNTKVSEIVNYLGAIGFSDFKDIL